MSNVKTEHETEIDRIHNKQLAEKNAEITRLKDALERSVALQSHYAMLLNGWDGGLRLRFASAEDWMNRLDVIKARDANK